MQQYYDAIERMALTGKDLIRLRVLEWLVSQKDEDRRTGRTLLLALAFIRTAAQDGPLDIFDHVPGEPGLDNMRNIIGGLIPSARLRPRGGFFGPAIVLSVDPVPAAPDRPSIMWQRITNTVTSTVISENDKGALQSLMDDLRSLFRSLASYGLEEEELVSVVRETVRKHSVRSVMKE